MKAVTKVIFTNDNKEKFFGEGPCRLLRGIEATGSLRSAAMEMNMAYTKALKMLKHAEKELGFPLTTRMTGGKDGGGSRLTEQGKDWLLKYESYRDACKKAAEDLYREYFPRIGCVIMASGMGVRFGGNKLMADFGGSPMINRILQATEGLLLQRTVVTRHRDVDTFCREQSVQTILHDQPMRSDTIRLGIEALQDMEACIFCPGDQPLLKKETVKRLIEGWNSDRDSIWRVSCKESMGSPVLFPKWAFPELLALPEGKGGNVVIQRYPERIRTIEVKDPYELMDADTPEILKDLILHFTENN